MMLTGIQLDNGLLYAGMGVWGIVLARWVLRGNPLRIDLKPEPSAVAIGWETVVIVPVLFLVAAGFVRELLGILGIGLAGPAELRGLTLQMLTDILVKIFAALGMILILRRTVDRGRFFSTRPIFDSGVLKDVPFLAKVVLLAGVIYLAIYPLVNKLLLWLGLILADRVFHMPAPTGHQVFELLNDPQTSMAIKTVLILLAIIISPIAEELFFRGLVQNLAYKNFRHAGAAITLTAIFFTLVHVPLYHQFPALFGLGLVLGWSYYRFRSLLVPIAVHILFNGTTLVLWSLGFAE